MTDPDLAARRLRRVAGPAVRRRGGRRGLPRRSTPTPSTSTAPPSPRPSCSPGPGRCTAPTPDLRHELLDVVTAPGRLVVAFRMCGTHTGPLATPLGTVAPTGASRDPHDRRPAASSTAGSRPSASSATSSGSSRPRSARAAQFRNGPRRAVRDGVAPCVRPSWYCCSPSPSRGARSRSCRAAACRPPRRRREPRRTRRPAVPVDNTIDASPGPDDQDSRAGDERTAVSITNEFWSRWFDDQGLRYVPPTGRGRLHRHARAALRGRAVGARQRLLLPVRELPRVGRGPHAGRVQRRSATRGSTW